ncbi:HNH endonuclease signature motif containing protein [Aeromonas salmonicida]|uniref:HNH endonuclease signature motif containing protein n=1 Tax=Aeromonas salmonicida TaxID=645 RepID=UPI003D208E98
MVATTQKESINTQASIRIYMKNQSQISTSTNNNSFYNSGAWRVLRDGFMSRKENLLCRRCLVVGITTPAEIADHIIEISDNWDLRLDPLNLQPLCWCCHNTKTAEQRTKRNQKAPTASSLMNPTNQLNEPAVPTTSTNNLMRFLNARANTNKNQST